jgi:hypothetical protein
MNEEISITLGDSQIFMEFLIIVLLNLLILQFQFIYIKVLPKKPAFITLLNLFSHYMCPITLQCFEPHKTWDSFKIS